MFALERWQPGLEQLQFLNEGTGVELSISELAEQVAAATGYCGTVKQYGNKPDGTPKNQLDLSRLKALGLSARIPLSKDLTSTATEFYFMIAGGFDSMTADIRWQQRFSTSAAYATAIPGIPRARVQQLEQLWARQPSLQEVWLFGSRAMGRQQPGSDIDLCLEGSGLSHGDRLRLMAAVDELPPELDAHVQRVGRCIWTASSVPGGSEP